MSESIMPDFGHIHHRLMRAGLSQKRSVAVLWTCSACLAGAGCVIGSFSGPIQVVVIVGLGLALFAVISHFGLFKRCCATITTTRENPAHVCRTAKESR